MDKELLTKVCYQLGSMAGFMKLTMPKVYHELYDLNDRFTKDELDEILDLAEQSDEYKAVATAIGLLKDKEENNG